MTYKPKYFYPSQDEDDSIAVDLPGVKYTATKDYVDENIETEDTENDLLNILKKYRYYNQDAAIGYQPMYSDYTTNPEPEDVLDDSEIYSDLSIDTERVSDKFKNKEEFKATMLKVYRKVLKEMGLNEDFAKCLAAQDGLESAGGTKPSGKFNYGGVKGKGTIKSTREFLNGQGVVINDSFRNFQNLEDYAKYKVKLLNGPRYNVFAHPVNEFAYGVKRGGYATAPNYIAGLNNIIESFKNGGAISYTPNKPETISNKNNGSKFIDEFRFKNLFTPVLQKIYTPNIPDVTEDVERPLLESKPKAKETPIKTFTPKKGFERGEQRFRQFYEQSGAPMNEYAFGARKAQDESGFRYDIVGRYVDPETEEETTGLGLFQQLDTHKSKPMPIARHYSGVGKEEYLSNPIIQIQAAQRMKNDIIRQFTEDDGRVAAEKHYSPSAMIAGAGAGGVGGVRNWLHHGYNAVDMHFKHDPNNKRAGECSVAGQMDLLNGYFKKGGVLKFYTGGTSPSNTLLQETREGLRDLNGKSKYEVDRGKSFVKFYDRLRTGSSESLQGGNFNLVLDEYNGEPIVYPTIIAGPNGKLIDLQKMGLDPRQMAIDHKNYIVAPSTTVAQNFIDNYQNMGYGYPDYQSTAIPQTNSKSSSPEKTDVVAVSSIDPNLPYIHKTNLKLDLNQIADDGTKYDDIVSNRIKMASDALRRAGFTNQSDIDRLSYFLAAQSIRETGWVDKDPRNNYGGYLLNDKKITYESAEDFGNKHIRNLNEKYIGGDSANSITEYLNILNDPDGYLLSEAEIKAEQARREKNGEFLGLYAPAYANKGKDYTKEVMDIIDRFTFYYLN